MWRRGLVEATELAQCIVHRHLTLFGLQSRRFRRSKNRFLTKKFCDVVRLYLNPTDHARVLCVDEKSWCYALRRTQPQLPMSLGYVEGVTHDYVFQGAKTIFAALDVDSAPY